MPPLRVVPCRDTCLPSEKYSHFHGTARGERHEKHEHKALTICQEDGIQIRSDYKQRRRQRVCVCVCEEIVCNLLIIPFRITSARFRLDCVRKSYQKAHFISSFPLLRPQLFTNSRWRRNNHMTENC